MEILRRDPERKRRAQTTLRPDPAVRPPMRLGGRDAGPEVILPWSKSPLQEGDRCPYSTSPVCDLGHMIIKPTENCSCHINPPCASCTSAPLICDECGFEYHNTSEDQAIVKHLFQQKARKIAKSVEGIDFPTFSLYTIFK